jgi:hypothetical protein
MPRTCTVCNHPKAPEITEALLGGEAYRSIARRFGASESAMYRTPTGALAGALGEGESGR